MKNKRTYEKLSSVLRHSLDDSIMLLSNVTRSDNWFSLHLHLLPPDPRFTTDLYLSTVFPHTLFNSSFHRAGLDASFLNTPNWFKFFLPFFSYITQLHQIEHMIDR